MEDILAELRDHPISLHFDGATLDVKDPDGVLTPQLRNLIDERRVELLSLLKGEPNPPDLSGVVPDPRERNEAFSLTDIQNSYLIGRNKALDLGGVSTNFYAEFDAPALDVPRLTEAFQKVIKRHDMLRVVIDSGGRQRVLRQVEPYEIPVRDLRHCSDAARSAALEDVRRESFEQFFVVDQWPLFDVRVSVLDVNHIRLHLSFDLLCVDIRSIFLVLNEWRRYYDEPTWSPEPLEMSFRDYVLAEHALQDEPLGKQSAEYWKSRLEDIPPAPELPLAVAPEQVDRPTFVRRRRVIPRQQWDRLAAVARGRGVTPSTVLLAAYCEVLRTWSKRQDFTVTLTSFGRLPFHSDVCEVAGNFLTPDLLAVTGGNGQTFAERAADLQRRVVSDTGHSGFSGISVLRELTRHQADRRGVSAPVVFSNTLQTGVENANGRAMRAFGDLVYGASHTPQTWLENQIIEEPDGIAINWNAVDELFPGELLDAMYDAYLSLLDRLVADETAWDRTGGAIPLPSDQAEERRQANATHVDLPTWKLHEIVADAARKRPDAVAIIAEETEFTYGYLAGQANRVAHRLRDGHRTEPNTITAVAMRPGVNQVAALLGIMQAGAAYVSIDPDVPKERRTKLLSKCGAEVLVTQENLRDRFADLAGVELVAVDEEATQRCGTSELESKQDYDDLAYVIFTSGSTGEPKGVMISHRNASNTIQEINRRFDVGPNDRVLALAPTEFDLSVYDIFGVLGAGGTLVYPQADQRNDIGHWSKLIDDYGITIWNSVPAPMRMWIDSYSGAGSQHGSTLRLVLLSGDSIPVDLPNKISETIPGAEVISLGGATEGSIWSICYPIGEVPSDWTLIPYGKPLANQTFHVYNTWLEPTPVGVTGEIYIGGVGVAQGYWADRERTAERFITHPNSGERIYRTGDLGRYAPGGDIEILGREDFQVKINGYRVELGEIEAVLGRQPDVHQVLVVAPSHPHTGQRQITAYIATESSDTLDTQAFRSAAEDALPSYMVPTHYIGLAEFPLTPNGKIDRAALPEPWTDTAESESRTSPENEVEKRLFEVWTDQLGHDDFGLDVGFFDVGGDSLHAVRIIDKLRAEFTIDSATEQEVIEGLFMNATIADFARIIAPAQGE